MNENCVFCKIVEGKIPSSKVHEDEESLAFLDIQPVNLGHTLVIPKKHFADIHTMPEDLIAHVMKVAKKISSALRKIGADGTNIQMNNGEHAGQLVFHSHTHVIPRYKGDGKNMGWRKRGAVEKELEEVARKIIQAL